MNIRVLSGRYVFSNCLPTTQDTFHFFGTKPKDIKSHRNGRQEARLDTTIIHFQNKKCNASHFFLFGPQFSIDSFVKPNACL